MHTQRYTKWRREASESGPYSADFQTPGINGMPRHNDFYQRRSRFHCLGRVRLKQSQPHTTSSPHHCWPLNLDLILKSFFLKSFNVFHSIVKYIKPYSHRTTPNRRDWTQLDCLVMQQDGLVRSGGQCKLDSTWSSSCSSLRHGKSDRQSV